MKRLLGFRAWQGAVSVVVAAALGVVTNLVTGSFSWTLAVAGIALVVLQVGLSVFQGSLDARDRRALRDTLLGELRPAGIVPSELRQVAAAGIVFWLTSPYSPTPLWGRERELDRLLAWCTSNESVGVVRVVAGPVGVGKSRLALAVAEALPASWATGRVIAVNGLVERIVACGDRTLLIVDDAERTPDLGLLIEQAARHQDLIRLLLLTREETGLRMALPDSVHVQLAHRPEVLSPIGGESDRQRWFREATRAYAYQFNATPTDTPIGPVGDDMDTLLVLHARALLAVLNRAGARTLTLREITTELVAIEVRQWNADQTALPVGCNAEVLSEVITVLTLFPAESMQDAAEALCRVPQFSHEAAQESRMVAARWARHRYATSPDHHLDMRPHLLGERLLIDTLTTQCPQVLHDLSRENLVAAVAVLARAYGSFSDALPLLTATLEHHSEFLPEALSAVFATGVTGLDLDRALTQLVTTSSQDTAATLASLSAPQRLVHLRCALAAAAVTYRRDLSTDDRDRYRLDLADALNQLRICLQEIGRLSEAVAAGEEAVALTQQLTESDPDRSVYVTALTNLGLALWEAGRPQEALAAAEEVAAIWREHAERKPDHPCSNYAAALMNLDLGLRVMHRPQMALAVAEEATAIWRDLTQTNPHRYRNDYAFGLTNISLCWRDMGRHREALAAIEEAVDIRREAARLDPDQNQSHYATTLSNLAIILDELGRHGEALVVDEEAAMVWRELVAQNPDGFRPTYANVLISLSSGLRKAGRYGEALTAATEAREIHRRLAQENPERYRPDHAAALTSLGLASQSAGQHREALVAIGEALAIRRELAEQNPEQNRSKYAEALTNFGLCLRHLRRPADALPIDEEAVSIRRELSKQNPDRERPSYAHALTNLGICRQQLGDSKASLEADREAVAVWKLCAEQDPNLYGGTYRSALANLHKKILEITQHDSR
jgi:tetratricopeptide (TPR) repeat protein